MSNSDIKVFIKHELAPESCDGGLPQSTAVQNVDPLNIKYEAMEIKEEAGDPEFSENNSYLGPQVLDFVKKVVSLFNAIWNQIINQFLIYSRINMKNNCD